MGWEMEEEIEAVLERIWDLHDKISDAIHALSRAHFLRSIKSLAKSDARAVEAAAEPCCGDGKGGFVFTKDFLAAAEDGAAMAAEARSLDAIRAALENLEDHFEFFHTVQLQQRAERDAAVAQLEQSRIVLAMRLANHQGKKYKVIEEALAFVGDVHDKGCFITPEALYDMPRSQSGDNLEDYEERRSSIFLQMVVSSLSLAKRSFRLENISGVFSHAAIFAASMLAFLQLHQISSKSSSPQIPDQLSCKRSERNTWVLDNSSQNGEINHLDVLSARG
ncbi:plastid division protein PDV1 [Musa acuminata AAA Group]|uniref:plastid division protein PDV1 n=1 Tax=Musa acuminata AAA Group TaxID=214697 RepID=UPI0031D3599C